MNVSEPQTTGGDMFRFVRSKMRSRVHRWTTRGRLALSASLLVAACSGAPEQEPSSTKPPSVDQEPTTIDAQVIGGGDYPGYTVEAPTGWSTLDGHFVVKGGSGVLGLSVWDVGEVPRNPCHWKGNLYDPGPTVDDLVAALEAQSMRHATTPTDVTIGGYHGRYLEWSVPNDMVVTGEADFEGCDVQPDGHRDFVSWLGNGFGERYQQVAGQVDMLWVLDVDGQRLVIDATYSPDATKADRADLAEIMESLRFTDHAE